MYRKRKIKWMKHLDIILLDLMCTELSFFASGLLRDAENVPMPENMGIRMALILSLIYVSVVFFCESYKGILRRGYRREFSGSLRHVTSVVLLSLIYLFFTGQAQLYTGPVILGFWGLHLILTYVVRSLWKHRMLKKSGWKAGRRSLLLVTTSASVKETVDTIRKNGFEDMMLTGMAVIDAHAAGECREGIPVVADLESLPDYLQKNWVDEVFLQSGKQTAREAQVLEICGEMGITVHRGLVKADSLTENQVVEKLGGYIVLSSSIRMAPVGELMLKRLMDIIGGVVGVFLTGILTIFIAPAIKLRSPGPVFFSQIRVGRNGKKFKMYKFRSMYIDAEERKAALMEQNKVKGGLMFKIDDDPRIIKGIGSFLRKTSLDEFPQFWNVLKGDMSLVGTRPPTVDEWNRYDRHHRKRLCAKPGITGIWQVSGRSSITDFEEVVRMDTEYITNWNIGLDCRTLWKTVGVVLRKEGSA